MTYNQVQPFQIDDCTNHYGDSEITEYRVLYSESIAGKGVSRPISWLGTAGPVNCFDFYIRVCRSFSIFTGRVQPTFGYAHPWLCH